MLPAELLLCPPSPPDFLTTSNAAPALNPKSHETVTKFFHNQPLNLAMAHKAIDSLHSIDSCTFQLHSWRPFHLQPSPEHSKSNALLHSRPSLPKRPCLSDRSTSFSIDSIDLSKLSLRDSNNYDDKSISSPFKRGTLRLLARKRRRRGSRSVSGRSSDRSGTRRCCSVGASAAHGTCSDFPVAVATDSSGELFVNGDANWASDVSDAKNSGKEKEEKEIVGGGQFGNLESLGNESGYGSEPGYRGDAEFGYGDEFDEEEEDARLLFWGHQFGGNCYFCFGAIFFMLLLFV